MTPLDRFLQRNSIKPSQGLPLVHSAAAYTIRKIIQTKEIVSKEECKVFRGEKINYFFVGRPAYKKHYEIEGDYWELPACVILDYKSVPIKRIFPFDTGAFDMYPDFIKIMDRSDFEVSSTNQAVERLIGSFFISTSSYFKLRPRNASDFERRFEIGTLDEEIKALYKLILSKTGKYDDRRFSIEVQSDPVVALTDNVLAVVFPEEYCESDQYMAWVEQDLKAIPLPYQSFPLKKEFYYYAMYEAVLKFYQSRGWVK
jgi:hypothetical protein